MSEPIKAPVRAADHNTLGELNICAWIRKPFDENHFELLSVAPGRTGLIAGQPGEPQTCGLTIAKKF